MAGNGSTIFISHNKADKPWVAAAAAQWRAAGVDVFESGTSILAGASIVPAIDEGLRRSRFIVLVLSKASLASPWVELETVSVIHDDPAGRGRRLIPVLLDRIPQEDLPLGVRTRKQVDLTNPETRHDEYLSLLDALEIRDRFPDPPAAPDLAQGMATRAENTPTRAASGSPIPLARYAKWMGVILLGLVVTGVLAFVDFTPRGVVIKGTVVDETGAELADVKIQDVGGAGRSTMSLTRGEFVLDLPQTRRRGQLEVYFGKPGFSSQKVPVDARDTVWMGRVTLRHLK